MADEYDEVGGHEDEAAVPGRYATVQPLRSSFTRTSLGRWVCAASGLIQEPTGQSSSDFFSLRTFSSTAVLE